MSDTSTPVIVTGMHRSGTSLLANLLLKAGVDMGRLLLEPDAGNRRGYFEDDDFVALHKEILADNGTSWFLDNAPAEFCVTDERAAQARRLIAIRADRSAWGWKDPRTALLLDFWVELLPNAKFVFIFRDAEQVVDSLRRRGDNKLIHQFHGAWPLRKLGFSTFRVRRAIDMWLRYNEEIVRFVKTHPEQSQVLSLASLQSQWPVFLGHMRETWGFNVKDIDVSSVLERKLLSTDVSWWIARTCRRRHDVEAMTKELLRLSSGGTLLHS